ncbi:hypothetical protein RB195_003604 [Necator americanus]|uniref:Nematode fatty acid retinoid binding protein n=1 Tax=Necator americanus TaxID=51031 RepID=A0ABR1DPB2_NECAM
MLLVIVCCATLCSSILAKPVQNTTFIFDLLLKLDDQEMDELIKVMKIMRDTSLTIEDRCAKVEPFLEGKIPNKALRLVMELNDYVVKLVESSASSKVKDLFNKFRDLWIDKKFLKMKFEEKKAAVEKIRNSFSKNEVKELEKLEMKIKKKQKELGIEDFADMFTGLNE